MYPTKAELTAKFEHIERVLNARIGIESRRRKNRIPEAINWADLCVRYVEYIIPSDGDPFYRATIQEASPDCRCFIEAMHDQLRRNDLADVQAVTEW
jgi:hypothetical protein